MFSLLSIQVCLRFNKNQMAGTVSLSLSFQSKTLDGEIIRLSDFSVEKKTSIVKSSSFPT